MENLEHKLRDELIIFFNQEQEFLKIKYNSLFTANEILVIIKQLKLKLVSENE